jgi:sialate O-acetylesterase
VPRRVADRPMTDIPGAAWTACSAETVANFSAVGYFFGRELHRRLGVPVGLINSSWGGTVAEAWTSREGLLGEPSLCAIVENYDRNLQRMRHELEIGNPNVPCALFNGMIAPLLPFSIRGVIWYQGESNVDRASQYRTLFPTLIRDWRRNWERDGLAFHFVQLANYMPVQDQPAESQWAELREAQSMTLDLPHTGMAVAIDVGEASDIHPRNKQDVGLRLALSALHKTYGIKDVVASGPLFRESQREGRAMRLFFDYAEGGLVCRGEKLRGFVMAGADGVFAESDAVIDGATVVVSCPRVPNPKAMRYAWADNPVCNLYNFAGLPASPFRTDQN